MARTIKEIKKGMTDAFMSDPTVRQRYGLSGSGTFDDTFSAVSVESILFFIVASAVHVLEVLFDRFRSDVDTKVATAVLASIPWYHRVCLEYQHGDELVYDEATGQFRYEEDSPARRPVKFAACRDRGGGILVLVSGEDAEGLPEALPDDILQPFRRYLNSRKPAGVIMEVHSYNPDRIRIAMKVQYDPLVMAPDGALLSDRTVFPVEDAVNSYLRGIVYGGVFNRTRLTDAVQSAAGVVDVQLGDISVMADGVSGFSAVSGNNYTAAGGALKADGLKNTIGYVLQL